MTLESHLSLLHKARACLIRWHV